MKCKKAQLLISAHIDGETTQSEWLQTQQHIENCAGCTGMLQAFQQSTLLFREKLPAPEPATDFWPAVALQVQDAKRLTRLERWQERRRRFWQDFIIAPPATIRVAQSGVLVAGLAVWLILILQTPQAEKAPVETANNLPASEVQAEQQSRQRFLQASLQTQVNSYLEKAGLLLLEVKNGATEADEEALADLSRTSQSLLEDTIILKKSLKAQNGAHLLGAVEQLEVLLLEIANLNNDIDRDEIDYLKATIAQDDWLIKIEIYQREEIDKDTRREKVDAVPKI